MEYIPLANITNTYPNILKYKTSNVASINNYIDELQVTGEISSTITQVQTYQTPTTPVATYQTITPQNQQL